MKRGHHLSYRSKLLMSYELIVVVMVLAITLIMTMTASRRAKSNNDANLTLLTEQVLINFETEIANAEQYLFTMINSTDTANKMYEMRNIGVSNSQYHEDNYELVYGLSRMITPQALYDNVVVRLDGGLYASNATAHARIVTEASELLSQELPQSIRWTRTESGRLFLLRDVYHTQPLRHVGRIAASIDDGRLTNLGADNQTLNCIILFFDEEGNFIDSTGTADEAMVENCGGLLARPEREIAVNDSRYLTVIRRGERWQAVGLLPMATYNEVQSSVIRMGLLVAALGIVLGGLVALTLTHRLSKQVKILTDSMQRVSEGQLNLVIPAEGNDEFSQLTEHFNNMTARTQELLARVVQEEASKREAEYEAFEYRYRFLQWQIKPHFIYNALETVNALAKIDGNAELCDLIQHISKYFRQNAESMRRRFMTVEREFTGLLQYTYIYQKTYGKTLHIQLVCAPGAESALVPTMIIQPLLENALVHGVRIHPAQTTIRVEAQTLENKRLLIQIIDDGCGMSQSTIEHILSPQQENADRCDTENRSSIGVRNVLDRMRLIYGAHAGMRIESREEKGTTVSIELPLCYGEADIERITVRD